MAGVSGFVNAVYRSVTSFLSPEERGVRIADITRNASVQFCKRFWSLAENRFLIEVPNLLLPQLAVAHTFTLPNIPITLNVDSGWRFVCQSSRFVIRMITHLGCLLSGATHAPGSILWCAGSIPGGTPSRQCRLNQQTPRLSFSMITINK